MNFWLHESTSLSVPRSEIFTASGAVQHGSTLHILGWKKTVGVQFSLFTESERYLEGHKFIENLRNS